MQLPVIIVLFGLMLELVEFNETYKIKPYKYYNPHPWQHPRWHPLPKHRKRYRPKRIPSHKYYEPEPDYDRYASHHEDSIDTSDHEKPYIIVIQLPQSKNEKKGYNERKAHVIEPPRNNDYIDDADELKVYQLKNSY